MNGHYHHLNQHFRGWEIETDRPVFNPQLPTLFDFRTPQDGHMRFVYTLPFAENRALIEYTLFSAHLAAIGRIRRGTEGVHRRCAGHQAVRRSTMSKRASSP